MENNNFQKNIEKVKELLNKILNENLDTRISKLETNSKQELSMLSLLSNSSTDIINNISQYSNKIKSPEKKKLKIPELKLDNLNSNKSHKINELEGILKNSKYKNKRNKDKPSSSIFDIDDYNSKTNVFFCQKDLNGTPDHKIKSKPFMTQSNINKNESKINKTFIKFDSNNEFNKKKKKKNKIKNDKCLTERSNNDPLKTPLRLNLHRKLCKNSEIHNINSNTNKNRNSNHLTLNLPLNNKKEMKIKKAVNKTTINFYEKANKNIESIDKSLISRFNYESKTPEKKKVRKELMKHEKNLKSLCESMLVDVNKDELLVSHINLNEFFNKTGEKAKKFESNFKYCIQYILSFLTFNEIFKLCKTKKEILKIILNLLINQTEKSVDDINSILKKYNANNNKDLLFSQKLKPLELNSSSQKSIALLNSISKINFIKSIKSCIINNNINKNKFIKKIILIFDLYFISIGKKNILNNLNSDYNKKIEYFCNYFKNNKTKLLGKIIENDLKNKKFDDLIINNLYEYSKKNLDEINPNYYKKINKDIAIFAFIIKNILDFVGISNIDNKSDNKNNEQKCIIIHKSRLNAKNMLLDKLNQILNKFD